MTNLFQIADGVSVPTFCFFLLIIFGCFWKIHLSKTCDESTVWVEFFFQCGRIHFTLTKIMNKVISTKNRVFISLVGPSETGKSQLIYNWLKIGIFQPKFDKIYFFNQPSQPLYDVMQKEIENLEFVQGVNFEFFDFLKNKGTKYLLFLTTLVKRFAIQKPLLTLPSMGHIGVWAQSTLNTTFSAEQTWKRRWVTKHSHSFFKFPRDVMQVTTLGAQLYLSWELVYWYRDATSVPFGHLFIDLSPRTDGRLRYCTISGSIPSNFYIPDRLRQSKIMHDEHTKSLYSPSVPIAFPQMQKSLSSVLPKRFYPVSMRKHSKSAQRNWQVIKRHHMLEFQDEVWLLSLKRTTWKQTRNVLSPEKDCN